MRNTDQERRTRPHSYRILGWVTAVLFFYLFVSALVFSRAFVADLGIELNESVFFLCRRGAMLLLVISLVAFFARNAPHSSARQAILLAVGLSLAGLAGLGTFEFLRGFVNTSIFVPVAIESLVALFHLRLWWVSRKLDGMDAAAAKAV